MYQLDVFFLHIARLFSSARGSCFSCSQSRGHARGSACTLGASLAPAERRGACSRRPKSRKVARNHGIRFRRPRANQAHRNPKPQFLNFQRADRFYKKLKNVSCEYDRLNGFEECVPLQATTTTSTTATTISSKINHHYHHQLQSEPRAAVAAVVQASSMAQQYYQHHHHQPQSLGTALFSHCTADVSHKHKRRDYRF